jgi:hypothetical protein
MLRIFSRQSFVKMFFKFHYFHKISLPNIEARTLYNQEGSTEEENNGYIVFNRNNYGLAGK